MQRHMPDADTQEWAPKKPRKAGSKPATTSHCIVLIKKTSVFSGGECAG